jgi:tetratricopeptide (TPR) repeat protein
MGLFSWFRRPLQPLSHFETVVGDISPLDKVPLETLERAQAAYLEALALRDAGDERAAIGKYTEAIEISPAFWEALDNRGLSRMRLGLYAQAIPDLERSAQIARESPLALVALIRCYRMTGQFRKAFLTAKYCGRKWPGKSPFPDWEGFPEAGEPAAG